jgi:hypothetical protein
MVAPDRQFADLAHTDPSLGRQLPGCTVMVETDHRADVLAIEARGMLGQNPGVCVGGIAHHQHLGAALGHAVQRHALSEGVAWRVRQATLSENKCGLSMPGMNQS